MKYRIGIQILSFNKPKYLKKTLNSLIKQIDNQDKICILEQSDNPKIKEECLNICKEYNDIHVIDIDENKGQRGATNIIYNSGFFNDCKFVMLSDHDNIFHEPLTVYCDRLNSDLNTWIATGLNSPEHDFENKDGEWLRKSSARAGHMVLRQKDFLSMCPINEEFGTKNPDYGCAWFAGLDWWLTHWNQNSPGHKRVEIISVFPGGVEHIGRESTWQGNYDDEYEQDVNLWFRTASAYEIIKKYKPRHTYMNYKYWYEKIDIESINENDKKLITPPDRPQGDDIDRLKELLNKKLNIKLDKIDSKYFKSPFKDSTTKSLVQSNLNPITPSRSNIIAFNYMWPAYGYQFLEKSIESVLPYVKKYILYLNKYSYIGASCSNSQLAAVNKILKNFDDVNVEVIYNESKDHPEEVKIDNIKYYIQKTLEYTKGKCDYIWYVSTDEIYDTHIAEDILNKSINKEITNCIITQPICYIDNPHWFVNPPEDFTRPSIIPNNSNINLNNKHTSTELTFHHLSFVMTVDELETKFNNWGHRNDVKGKKGIEFIKTFNDIKTNKYITNFHPVQPSLYKTMAFANDNIHREMFFDWMYYLITTSKYDNQECVENIPNPGMTDDLFYPMTHDERRFTSAVLSNFLPKDANFLDIGSRAGWNLILSEYVSNVNWVGVEPDQDNYSLAVTNLLKNKLPMNIMHGTVKQLVPKFPNNYFHGVFINKFSNPDEFKEALIEVWPKLTDFSIIFGLYDQNDPKMIETLKSVIGRAIAIQCPWGKELFRCYELYYDIFGDIEKYKNVKFNKQHTMWIARIRKS